MTLQFPTTCPHGIGQSAVYLPDKKKVVVIGGTDGGNHALGYTQILDLTTGQWSNGPQLNTPRYDLAAVYCQSQSKIYAIGGSDSEELNSIEILDAGGNIGSSTWTALPSQYILQRPRVASAAVLIVDRFLVVMGGYANSSPIDTVEILDIQTCVQHKGPSMSRPRGDYGATVVGNKIVACGAPEQVQAQEHGELEFIEFNINATTVYELFPQSAQWKIHPTLKISFSDIPQLFSLDPKLILSMAIGSQVVELVELENAKVPISQCSFSIDRGYSAAVLLPANQQLYPAGILAIGGNRDPTSMEWLPLPDDIHVRLKKYQTGKIPDFPPLPPKPTISTNPKQLKSSLQQWVQKAESILTDYMAHVEEWKDQEEKLCQDQCSTLQEKIDQLRAQQNNLTTTSTARAKKYVGRCKHEIGSIRGITESLGRGQTVADALAKLQEDGPPHELCCPITFELMTDPVVIESGHTYERAAITQHW
eukprot:CAMPEP_0168729020 /NCGR_PEP_ID=MMETSP0724-20121128/5982_1 /TAXON_ID=265536 /ORGANISM="Amphiprora sp., Strain CCMP467" /LENGTH=477 /DNA_ID=CAMNT_0008775879 /DNA_START=44 /DNA_END=1475 /DNA_ORIENTATION=-